MPNVVGTDGGEYEGMYEKMKQQSDQAAGKPVCGKCGSSTFSGQNNTFGGLKGVMVYCVRCGTVVGWSANPAQ